MIGLGAYDDGDRPRGYVYEWPEGGVMLGSETLTGDRFVMEGGGREGVPVRGIVARGAPPVGEPLPSTSRARDWPFVRSPFEVGLSKFWTPIGREHRWSGVADACRIEPFCIAEAFEPRSCEAKVLLALWIGGKARDPNGGKRLLLSSCGEVDVVRDLVAGPCDMDSSC